MAVFLFSLFNFAFFMTFEEIPCFFYYDAIQGKNCNHIWNCHQTVKDISNCPHGTDGHIWTDKYGKNVNPAEYFYMFHIAATQIFQTALAVIIPAKNCCKGKEYKAEH